MNFIRMFNVFDVKRIHFISNLTQTVILTLVFLLFSSTGVWAQDKKFNISKNNATVGEVLEILQRTSDYGIFYQDSDLDFARKVRVNVSNASIEQVLDILFAGTANTYTVRGKQVTIRKDNSLAAAAATAEQPAAREITVTGRVTDATGAPVVGANVLEVGTGNGMSTGPDGTYTIRMREGATLYVSFLGYETVFRRFEAGEAVNGHARFDVRLETEGTDIEDVVVIGYGVRKRGTVAGSVSSVKAADINNVPSATLEQALQGKAPGLSVVSSSGEPSSVASMQIRGVNSINSGTTPLIIVDGIAVTSTYFSSINPNDIETFNVLKDATSTAIFGSRAANGVLLITTKKGVKGEKGLVTFRTQLGFSNLAYGNWDMMNTAERIRYEHEVGIASSSLDYEELAKTDINWKKKVYKNNAPLRSYEVNVGGGSEVFNYYISGGYFGQEGIAPNSDFDRYNLRANVEFRVNDWLKVGTTNAVSREKVQSATSGMYYTNAPISAAFFMMPYYNPYNEDGSLASTVDGTWKGMGVFTENPLEYGMYNYSRTKRYKLLSSIFAELTPIDGLRLRSTGFIDYMNQATYAIADMRYPSNGGEGGTSKSTGSGLYLSISNQAEYSFNIDKEHFLTFMVGQEMQNDYTESLGVTVAGHNNPMLMTVSAGPRAENWADGLNELALISIFGRAEYNYLGKYYAEGSLRTDGSSRFGKNNRYGTFWSLGFMWDFGKESFMSNIKWLNFSQLSVGVGTQGNSNIPNYLHQALVEQGYNYLSNAGMAVSSRGNDNLTWEKVTSLNVGLKLGMVNRVSLGLEFYDKKTTDMLMDVPVSMVHGMGTEWENIGEMTNRGFEVDLSADLIRNQDWRWGVYANVSYNKNRITKLYADRDLYEVGTSGIVFRKGKPYGEFYMVRFAGVNPSNGDALWYTADGKITNVYNDSDRVFMGKTMHSPLGGGFGTNLSWKNVTFSAHFNWVAKRWMLNNDRYYTESNGRFTGFNQSKKMFDRWQQPGDITDIPRYGVLMQSDTRVLENASFLRLKNLSVSYSLPKDLLHKTKFFRDVRVYAQAQNLLTFTSFTGLDPESTANVYRAAYPMSRQFTFGLDITF